MDADYYSNLICLVVALEHLFVDKVNKNNLDAIQGLLELFVSNLEELYKGNIMNSGVHELLHLTKCKNKFGSLNTVSCFVFEELNRKLLSLIRGRDLVAEEFIKLFIVLQNLNSFNNKLDIKSNKIRAFINENIQVKSSKTCVKITL